MTIKLDLITKCWYAQLLDIDYIYVNHMFIDELPIVLSCD